MKALKLCAVLALLQSVSAETLLVNPTSAYPNLFYGTVGYSFYVGSTPLLVTHLGVWDYENNGLSKPNIVGLWDGSGTLLAFAGIPPGTAAPITAGFRYATVGSPVILKSYTTYVLASFADGENGKSGGGNTFCPDATLVGTRANGSQFVFSYPTGSNLANQTIVGPNLKYLKLLPLPPDPPQDPQMLVAVEFRFNTANGVSYRIEASYDMVSWETIESPIIGTGGRVTRFYSTEGLPKRFFRVARN